MKVLASEAVCEASYEKRFAPMRTVQVPSGAPMRAVQVPSGTGAFFFRDDFPSRKTIRKIGLSPGRNFAGPGFCCILGQESGSTN